MTDMTPPVINDNEPASGDSGVPVADAAANLLGSFRALLTSKLSLVSIGVVAAALSGVWEYPAIKSVVASFSAPPVAPVESVSKDEFAKVSNDLAVLGQAVDGLKERLAGTNIRLEELSVDLESVRKSSDAKPAAKPAGIATGSIKRTKAPVEGNREFPVH